MGHVTLSRKPERAHIIARCSVFELSAQERNLRQQLRNRRANTLDKQEQFTLLHYNKAIRHLQPHFSTQDKASVRVALMTCYVFVCLELLCGHFATAQTHLKMG